MQDQEHNSSLAVVILIAIVMVALVFPIVPMTVKELVGLILSPIKEDLVGLLPSGSFKIVVIIVSTSVLLCTGWYMVTGHGQKDKYGKEAFPEIQRMSLDQVKEIIFYKDHLKSLFILLVGMVYFGLIGISILGIIFH